ncbi:MAG TPA: hypothetical protein VFP59_12720 [Candidatus Angelobacter sp.]|nr:hypothetical protein [Candidatus Angelobacter sp.]
MVVWVLGLLALMASCGVISPRRIVVNNPPSPTGSPTPPNPFPTPTATPTPTPTNPFPTATPTPTPTGMSAVVPKQFLFTADSGAGVILGFQINPDGGLSSVPGSPFVAADTPRLVAAVGSTLLVAGDRTLTAFTVNHDTGTIAKTDAVVLPSVSKLTVDPVSRMAFALTPDGEMAIQIMGKRLSVVNAAAPGITMAGSQTSVTDETGRFRYVLNLTGTIAAFAIQNGEQVSEGKSYPAGHGSVSLALVTP